MGFEPHLLENKASILTIVPLSVFQKPCTSQEDCTNIDADSVCAFKPSYTKKERQAVIKSCFPDRLKERPVVTPMQRTKRATNNEKGGAAKPNRVKRCKGPIGLHVVRLILSFYIVIIIIDLLIVVHIGHSKTDNKSLY